MLVAMEEQRPTGAFVNLASFPPMFPTHTHDLAFWCSLGRAVATFGFLEEMLGKATFALAGSVDAPEEAAALRAAVGDLHETLELVLTKPLGTKIDEFEKAATAHPQQPFANFAELVDALKEAARVRNVICHGSWGPPNERGASIPFFATGKGERILVFDTPVDVAWLDQLQKHVVELACQVINAVTLRGYRFPGSSGPGKPL
ncbi:MAG: hypothetical protein ACK5BN_08360 [Planctomycetota bacterium]